MACRTRVGGITSITAAGCLGNASTLLLPVTSARRQKAKVSAPSEGLSGNQDHLLFAAPDEVSKDGPKRLFSPRKKRCKCYSKTSRNGDSRYTPSAGTRAQTPVSLEFLFHWNSCFTGTLLVTISLHLHCSASPDETTGKLWLVHWESGLLRP